ncbi:YciI family protein [Bosea sp. 2KB_26]|uniref:YciI family protein n=1 Tax=Bosea sp. 2KB_26 TaxID=3237475 RepID=UPI000DE2ACA3
MRYMIIVKATSASEAGVMPDAEVFSQMADYHEQLVKADVLVDAGGLQPSDKGWRIAWRGGRKSVVDGPFAEAKELIAGYTIINVASREEALEWASRFPNPLMSDSEIEIRQMFELDDFEQGEAIQRFRDMGVGGA